VPCLRWGVGAMSEQETLTEKETVALWDAIETAKRHEWDPERQGVLNSLKRKLRRADTIKLHPDD